MPAMGITEEIILKRECASHDVQFQQILNEILQFLPKPSVLLTEYYLYSKV
jgi:hypothetical protein